MKKQIVLILAVVGIMLLATGCASAGTLFIPEVVYGSGNVIEQTFDVAGFTDVSIANRFTGVVEYGEAFSVVVRADDNIIDDVLINVEGDTLQVLMARKNYQNVTAQHITITMPALEEIALHGVSKVIVQGFPQAPSFVASVEGASDLGGEVHADAIDLTLAGTSEVTLSGEGETLVLTAGGLSNANLVELPVATAEITLSGTSRANITAEDSIAVTASGLSELRFGGGATLASSTLEGGSTVVER